MKCIAVYRFQHVPLCGTGVRNSSSVLRLYVRLRASVDLSTERVRWTRMRHAYGHKQIGRYLRGGWQQSEAEEVEAPEAFRSRAPSAQPFARTWTISAMVPLPAWHEILRLLLLPRGTPATGGGQAMQASTLVVVLLLFKGNARASPVLSSPILPHTLTLLQLHFAHTPPPLPNTNHSWCIMSNPATPPLDYKATQPMRLDNNDEELHRYVTDDMPRAPKMSTSSSVPFNPQGALIVRLLTASPVAQPLRQTAY